MENQNPKKNAKILLGKFIFLVVFFTGLIVFAFIFSQSVTKITPTSSESFSAQNSTPSTDVLGASIYIDGSKGGYNIGGMLALASTDEPVVSINAYNLSGPMELSLYKANKEALIDFLLHDDKTQQIKKNPDVSKLQFVTSVKATSDNKFLLPLDETGIWFARIKYGDKSSDSFIVRSQNGVIVKEGDDELIFWGQNFKTKRSITTGQLRILNLTNSVQEIGTVGFGSDGVAKLPLNNKDEVALVEIGDDLSVVPINLHYLNTSYNYSNFQRKTRTTVNYTFTDRPIYKPGDTVYFKSILRDDDDVRYTVPSGVVEAKLYNGYGENNVIARKNIKISSEGTVNGDFKLPVNASSGGYNINLQVGEQNLSGSYFDVENYRKPESFIDVTSEKLEVIAGDKINFTITGSYFSGQPIINQKVKYRLYSSAFSSSQYREYENKTLSDNYLYGYGGGEILKEGEISFDSKGRAQISLDAIIPNNSGQSQVYAFEAEFDDGTGSPTFSRRNVLVNAGDFEIYRQQESISSKVNQVYKLPLELVANHEANLANLIFTSKVKLTWYKEYQEPNKKYPTYEKIEEDLPTISGKSTKDGTVSLEFTPTKKGFYDFLVSGKDSHGRYITKGFYGYVSDTSDDYFSSDYKSGLSIVADKERYLPTDTAKLTVSSEIPNRDIFLSLERARVNRFQIVHLDGKSKQVEIPLVNTDIPNMYVRVSSFSDSDHEFADTNLVVSTETKRLNVKVEPDKKKYEPGGEVTLTVTTSDSQNKPVSAETALWTVDKALYELVYNNNGSIFDEFWKQRYDYTQEGHSLEGISISQAEQGGGCFAADTQILIREGETKSIQDIVVGDTVLTRAGEFSPTLVKSKVVGTHQVEVSGYLIFNTNLKVTTNHKLWVNKSWKEANEIQIGDTLLNKDGKEVPVTSIEWQAGKFTVYNLQIENEHTFFANGIWVHNEKGAAREVFKDTAYWNPVLHTDSSGKAVVHFKLPDNLTTWVIASVGSTTDTKVGQTSTEILVTKDVIVRPILPNLLRVGDQAILGALVQNYTDKDQKFKVDFKFDSGEVKESAQEITIKSKDNEQVFFSVTPKKENDQAKVTLSATSMSDSNSVDTVIMPLKTENFGFYDKQVESKNDVGSYKIDLAKDSSKEKTAVSLALAPTILSHLQVAMNYLINYPYGCVEQTISQMAPAIIAKTNPTVFKDTLEDQKIAAVIKAGLPRISEFQHYDGGWSWWENGDSSTFITVYVVDFLTQAKKAGINVDAKLLSNAQTYLETGKEKETLEDKVLRVYGLSLLGSKKIPVLSASDLNLLSPDMLSMAVMANYLQGNKNSQTNGLDRLIKLGQNQGSGVFWKEGTDRDFGSVDASTAYALRAILLANGDQVIASGAARFLMSNNHLDYWSNSFATAEVVKALTEFALVSNEVNPKLDYTVLLDGKKISEGKVTDSKQIIKEIQIPAGEIKSEGSTLEVKKTGNSALYSTLVVNQFRTDTKAKEVDHGLQVAREYESEKGFNYSLGVGDIVNVKITVSGLKTDDRYGVVKDELPAGLVPVNEKLNNEQYNQDPHAYYYDGCNVTDKEYTENGIIMTLYSMCSGTHTYTYRARAVTAGAYLVPPAVASLMYSPEISGQSKAETIKIDKEAKRFGGASTTNLILGVLITVVLFAILVIGIIRKRRQLPPTPPAPIGVATPDLVNEQN